MSPGDANSGCERLFALGCRYARRVGVLEAEVEDCGAEFVEKMLGPAPSGATRRIGCIDAWNRRSARNHAVSYLRKNQTQRTHEAHPDAVQESRLLRMQSGRAAEIAGITPDAQSDPQRHLLRAELMARIHCAIGQLTPWQREVFIRHHFGGEQAGKLAENYGKRVNTVEAALADARKRLRTLLQRDGLDEQAVREYLG